MADPVTLPAGASNALGTAATLTCAQAFSCLSGVPLDLFIWGAVGGLIAFIYSEPKQPPLVGFALVKHAGGRLFSACVLGALSSGVLLPILANNVAWFEGIDKNPVAPSLVSVVVGISTALMPEVIGFCRAWLKRRSEQ